MPDALPLAFLGTSELIVIAVVGLLLFGGDLPKLLRDLGQIWVKMRRSVNEFKREAGLDQAVEEIRRVTDLRLEEPRWRRDMDHAAGPAGRLPADEVKVAPAEAPPAASEPASAAAAPPPAEPAPSPPPASQPPPPQDGGVASEPRSP